MGVSNLRIDSQSWKRWNPSHIQPYVTPPSAPNWLSSRHPKQGAAPAAPAGCLSKHPRQRAGTVSALPPAHGSTNLRKRPQKMPLLCRRPIALLHGCSLQATSASPGATGPVELERKPDMPPLMGKGSKNLSLSGLATFENPPGFHLELEKLLRLLPVAIADRLKQHPDLDSLVEVVLDLGRRPLARFPVGDWAIYEETVSNADLEYAVSQVGAFGADNRAGLDRTLHRISAIRNRAGKIVGLTCRVGRAIAGSAEMVQDLVSSGGSLLLMGPPGVGKTTAIRDVARLLADQHERRVVVVDTSNEIGGDGDVPHPGIGRARRMQVPHVDRQHEVMIEAVENHMPQTIVIDEIGTELEASAAGTISQRGVQLVGTAHGMTVDNLIKNPSLQILAGGIQSVTLGDEEARRRGVQKSVLERKGPPVFDCAVEMLTRTTWRVHRNLGTTVDSLLAGKTPVVEIRTVTPSGEVASTGEHLAGTKLPSDFPSDLQYGAYSDEEDSDSEMDSLSFGHSLAGHSFGGPRSRPLRLFLYQISEDSLEHVLEVMDIQGAVQLTDDVGRADAVLALRSRLKQNAWLRGIAKFRQLPIYALKSNTMPQMVRALNAILGRDSLGPGLKARLNNLNGTEELVPSSGDQGATWGDNNRDGNALKVDELGSGAGGVGWAYQLTGLPGGTAEEDGVSSWHAVGTVSAHVDEIDALEEARVAIEQIVLPLSRPVELLPRAPHVLDLQTKLLSTFQLASERVGTDPSCRIRILPTNHVAFQETTSPRPGGEVEALLVLDQATDSTPARPEDTRTPSDTGLRVTPVFVSPQSKGSASLPGRKPGTGAVASVGRTASRSGVQGQGLQGLQVLQGLGGSESLFKGRPEQDSSKDGGNWREQRDPSCDPSTSATIGASAGVPRKGEGGRHVGMLDGMLLRGRFVADLEKVGQATVSNQRPFERGALDGRQRWDGYDEGLVIFEEAADGLNLQPHLPSLAPPERGGDGEGVESEIEVKGSHPADGRGMGSGLAGSTVVNLPRIVESEGD